MPLPLQDSGTVGLVSMSPPRLGSPMTHEGFLGGSNLSCTHFGPWRAGLLPAHATPFPPPPAPASVDASPPPPPTVHVCAPVRLLSSQVNGLLSVPSPPPKPLTMHV